jgi:hypothetical protein
MKKAEDRIQLPVSELALQVSLSSPSCDSERQEGSDHRSCGCNYPILIPRIAVGGRENGCQDVRASKCWQRRAIENREEESPSAPKWRNIVAMLCPRFSY